MPLFSYKAINDDNKEVHGTIDAPDVISARQAIDELHLEVINVSETSRNHLSETKNESIQLLPVTKTIFAFEGTDEHGQTRRGTVEAPNKHEAFEHLKNDQKLYLTALSPTGITPPYRDYDLVNWQKKEVKPSPIIPQVDFSSKVQPEKKPLGFSNFPEGTLAGGPKKPADPNPNNGKKIYHPLLSTLRLYAGWLLAWYGLFVALGYYSHVRTLPFNIPFVEAFFLSPLIFTFVVAIFLFLMLTSIKRVVGGGIFTGFVLTILGIGSLVFVRMSIY